MADLMAKTTDKLVTFRKGDIIEGTITKLTAAEILIDIGAKTEAVVLEKDRNSLKMLLSSLNVGDKVNVQILNPESDLGNSVVSLRRFIEERLWSGLEEKKKSGQLMDAIVNDATRGGFLITAAGIAGFLPNSQVSFSENPDDLIAQTIKVSIIEINRQDHRVIFSQKGAVSSSDFQDKIKGLSKGQNVKAKITNVAPFGIFVVVDNKGKKVEGFIHQSEVSWEEKENNLGAFKKGDELEVQITSFDSDNKRVSLSLKRLVDDPFATNVKSLEVDKKTKAKVKKVASVGVTLELPNGVEGLIKKDKIPPGTTYAPGQEVDVTVSEIDAPRRRVILSPVLLEKPIGYR